MSKHIESNALCSLLSVSHSNLSRVVYGDGMTVPHVRGCFSLVQTCLPGSVLLTDDSLDRLMLEPGEPCPPQSSAFPGDCVLGRRHSGSSCNCVKEPELRISRGREPEAARGRSQTASSCPLPSGAPGGRARPPGGSDSGAAPKEPKPGVRCSRRRLRPGVPKLW